MEEKYCRVGQAT